MTGIIIIALVAILVLFLGVYKADKAILPVAVLGLLAALTAGILQWNTNLYYFNQMVLIDNYSIAFSSLTLVTTALILILSKGYFEKISTNVAEYVALILFAQVGVLCMTSYMDLSMLFIGIEIMSICMYVLAGIRKKDLTSNEAALKYLLMGSFATGFLLFGIALVYGTTGSFNLDKIGNDLRISNGVISPVFYVGVLFILVGLSFKVSAAPFHFWAPDVYDGAPSLITSFMSSVVKTASFAAFLRLFYTSFAPVNDFLSPTLWTLIVLTMLVGNVVAIYQRSFKRMLAYSSISHAGYMLIAILALSATSGKAMFLYAAAYSIASVIAFAALIRVKAQKGSEDFDAFNGLARKNPLLAITLTISMLSLAGIPLTAGFFGKFYMFSTALAQQYIWLVAIAILNAVIGIAYYFRVIIAMYMKEDPSGEVIELGAAYKFVLLFSAIVTVVLGVFPGILSSLI